MTPVPSKNYDGIYAATVCPLMPDGAIDELAPARHLAEVAGVVGVKAGSWETAAYEANLRLVNRVAPHVAMMASGDEHLMTCFAIGSRGSLVSLACVVPEFIVGLDRAIASGDLAAARHWHRRIY